MKNLILVLAFLLCFAQSIFAQRYVAALSQGGMDAPAVHVLQNTFPAPLAWERNNAGVYVVNGAFPTDRTVINQQWGVGADSQHWLPIFDFNDPNYILARYWKAMAVSGGNQIQLVCIGLDGETADLHSSLVITIEVFNAP